MSLASLAAASKDLAGPGWQTCSICHALATIPESEAEGLRELMRSKMRYSDIIDKVAADPDTPLQLERDALSRHARGLCSAREVLRVGAR